MGAYGSLWELMGALMEAYRYKIRMTLHVHACYAVIVAQAKLLIDRSLHCLRCLTAMVALTKERKAELRAKKALETGDASFKPRGEANKAMFETMKAEFDKKAKEINSHTSSVGDQIMKQIAPVAALVSGGDSTNPQDRIDARILQNAANNKANKADRELIREQKAAAKAEARGKAQAKAKAKGKANKPAASNATESTAAPSEQMESDRDEGMENRSRDEEDLGIISPPPLPKSRDEGEESSDEDEPMPPMKPTLAKPAPQESASSKDANQDEESSDEDEPMPPAKPAAQQSVSSKEAKQDEESSGESSEEPMPANKRRKRKHPLQETKKIALEFHPDANVVWSETCDDKEKENLRKPISDVTALLKDCKTFTDIKSTFHDYLPGLLNWPNGYELNWKEEELAVYIRRKSPYPYKLGELLCRVSRKV